MSSQEFSGKMSELPLILSWVRDQLQPTTLTAKEKMHLELAIEEAVVNVIVHSHPKHSFHLNIIFRLIPKRYIEVQIIDSAPAFNPLIQHPTQAQQMPLEEMQIGGKGLILMRQCSDALLYRREEDKNILTLVKNLKQESFS